MKKTDSKCLERFLVINMCHVTGLLPVIPLMCKRLRYSSPERRLHFLIQFISAFL